MEGLITKLMNCTAEQWARLSKLASTNPPSMATCAIVFALLRARREDRKAAQRTYAEVKAITDALFY